MILNRVAAFTMSLYGSRHGYDYYNELERITHVAIMYKGVMYTKEKPHRHHHIIKDMVDVHKLPKGLAGNVQGFIGLELCSLSSSILISFSLAVRNFAIIFPTDIFFCSRMFCCLST